MRPQRHLAAETSRAAETDTRHLHAVSSGELAVYKYLSEIEPVTAEPTTPQLLAEGQQVIDFSYGNMGHMGEEGA